MAKDAAPLIAAFEKGDGELLRVDWPAETRADVKALVAADGAVLGDLRVLDTVSLLSAGDWSNQFSQDFGKLAAAADIVRADLGLPSNQ